MESPFEMFGCDVFGEKEMEERLPRPVYLKWKETIANEGTLDRQTADAIAHAMKRWALERGVTHFTHWFQPLRGSTAEKHFAFIEPDDEGIPFTHLSGKMLIKGEQDASSFPTGGLRATFEARGYTYWDVTSPVFIKNGILCIPSIFVSYNGDALDTKAPLLRSIKVLDEAATNMMHLLGEKDVRHCTPVCGLEQEYFLVDRELYEQREDLQLCGRTLIGAASPKGQELSDHYSGPIPTRVREFMQDLNQHLWQLGIYANTEHNEVAPGQFELAIIYSPVNIHVDQNMVTMDLMEKLAEKHGLAVLFDEKPFARVNGSGKHDNYSIQTDTGLNVFSAGDKPAENIRFLVFISAFIKGCDEYAKVLRASANCVSNDHRLGATEAPPAIISVYLGTYIEGILMELIKDSKPKPISNVLPPNFSKISGLSYIPRDNTDRNRTSPVAFTGNKFEFRMVGSSMSAAMPNTALNTILAKELEEMGKELEGIKYLQDVRAKALELCQKIIREHQRILYSGDGYSEAWVKEAAKRGLPNITNYVDCLAVFDEKQTIDLFSDLNIFTKSELQSRKEVFAEEYKNKKVIEVKTLLEMMRQNLLPAMTREMAQSAGTVKDLGSAAPAALKEHIRQVSALYDSLTKKCADLDKACSKALAQKDIIAIDKMIYKDVCPLMETVRADADAYETICDRKNYPFPTYKDLFINL